MVKLTTLRFMPDVVAAENLELIQLDVKTSFLHGDVKQEIYMEQPKGFVASSQEHLVGRLKKSLYDLKQAPRQWYKKFDDIIQLVVFSKLKMGLPSSLSFTWTTCYSPVDIYRRARQSCLATVVEVCHEGPRSGKNEY